MVKLIDKEVREALDRVYAEEPSVLDEELIQMQLASLPEEDREEDSSNELDEETR